VTGSNKRWWDCSAVKLISPTVQNTISSIKLVFQYVRLTAFMPYWTRLSFSSWMYFTFPKCLYFIKNQPLCFYAFSSHLLFKCFLWYFLGFFLKPNRSFTFKSNSDVHGSFIGPALFYLKNKCISAPKLKCLSVHYVKTTENGKTIVYSTFRDASSI